MGLQEDFLRMLEEREEFTATKITPPVSKWDISAEEFFQAPTIQRHEEERATGAAVWDALGASAWAFANEALFGVPGAAIKRYGGEAGEEFLETAAPDYSFGKIMSGIAGFAGFAAPTPFSPLRVGSKIASKTLPFLAGVGGKTLTKATSKATKEVTNTLGQGAASEFASDIVGRSAHQWSQIARWDTKVAANWEKFAYKNIDDIVNLGVKEGKLTAKEGGVVINAFKSNFKDRPMIDIVDVFMKSRPDRVGFTMGQMVHEATMFGAIDAIMEGVHVWGDRGDIENFDWTAPLWGMGTGAAFGAMKYWQGAGKIANSWGDFKAGVAAWAGKDVFPSYNKNTLIQNTKLLGNEIKRSGAIKSDYIVSYMHKGSPKTLDMTNPESFLSEFTEKEGREILIGILKRKQQEIGKQMTQAALWEESKSALLNWKHMIGGALVMNARTFMAMSQGQDIPLEDFVTSLFLGGWVMRKGGGGKSYDLMQHDMMSLRRSLSHMGIHTGNYIDAYPSGSVGSNESLNPLNYNDFNDVRTKFKDLGITSNDPSKVESMKNDGSQSVTAASNTGQGDFSLFNKVYSYIHGASGERHIKSRDKITVKEAREIEKSVSKLEYTLDGQTIKLNNATNLELVLKDIGGRIHDRVENEVIAFVSGFISENEIVYYEGGKKKIFSPTDLGSENIGYIPKRVAITQKLFELAEKGQLEFLKNKETGEVLKGEEARIKLADYQRKIDAAFDFVQWIPGRATYYSGERGSGRIESADVLRKITGSIDLKENVFNRGFKINKPWLEFKMENLQDMAFPVAVRYMNKSIEKIGDTLDVTKEPYQALMTKLENAGILTGSETGVGMDILANPYSQVKIIKPQGMKEGDTRVNEAKQFINNLTAILGAKGQHGVNTKLKRSVSLENVESLIEGLNGFGITNNLKVFNMFAHDVVNKLATENVKGSSITSGDIYMLQEMMTWDIPMAHYGTKGTAHGFMVKRLEAPTNASTDYKQAVKEYNDQVDALKRRGKVGDTTANVIKDVTDKTITLDIENIKAMTATMKLARGEGKDSSLNHIKDFMNALDPNDSLRNSLGEYMDKYGLSADRLFWMLNKMGVIEQQPGTRKQYPKYLVNKDKIKNRKIRAEIKHWLGVEYGMRVDEINHLVSQAEKAADDLINGSRENSKSGTGTITVGGFFKKWFPQFTGEGKEYGTRIKDIDKYINDRLFLDLDHKVNPKVIDELVNDMEFLIGERRFTGKEIQKDWVENPIHKTLYFQAANEAYQILRTRLTNRVVKKINFNNGKLQMKEEYQSKTSFDKFNDRNDITYYIIDGNMGGRFGKQGKNIVERFLNIFEMESTKISNDRRAWLQQGEKHFRDLLNSASVAGINAPAGVSIIRFGDTKTAIGISKADAPKIVTMFNEQIYDKYYKDASPKQKEKLDRLKEELDSSTKYENNEVSESAWGVAHKVAYRALVLKEMIVGKDKDLFLDSLTDWNHNMIRDTFGKRFSLYHTKSAPKIEDMLLEIVPKNTAYLYGKDLVSKYKKRDIGVVMWNDKQFGGIKERTKEILEKMNLSWGDVTGGRENNSAYDSIGFVSKDFMDFLMIMNGTAGENHGNIKPIISSHGKNETLLFGKTLFVYDPAIEKDVFGKKRGLDVLMTRSADKLETIDQSKLINKSVEDMLNMSGQELGNHMFTLKKSSIGLIGSQPETTAKQSYSLWNFMQSSESSEIFSRFYEAGLIGNMSAIHRILDNPLMKSAAFRIIKNIDRDVPFDDMMSNENTYANFGSLMKWMSITDRARPEAFGEYMLMNALKAQFIDPILKPEAIIDGKEFGNKGVLSQSLKLRDLDISTVPQNNKKGEVVLPYTAKDANIHFGDNGMGVRFIDKNNGKDYDGYKKFKEVVLTYEKNFTEKDVKDLWNSITTLGELHNTLKDPKGIFKELLNDFDIGILVTRYPRTRPSDLGLVRLRGFGNEAEGNQVKLSDFDVYTIYEGDYDFDKVDYYWAHNRSTYRHVSRVKEHWFNAISPERYQGNAPKVDIIPENFTVGEHAWKELDANNRVFSNAIGTAQKTMRIVQHMYDLAAPIEGTSKRRIMKFVDHNNQEVEITIDAGKEWYHRMALEAQIQIDSWKGVSGKIVNDIQKWRKEFLYPAMDASIRADQITETSNPNNQRIRLYTKTVGGKETNLNEVDIAILNAMQDNYSTFAQLQTSIYEAGRERSPEYRHVIEQSRDYFSFMENISNNVFYKTVGKYGYKGGAYRDYYNSMFNIKRTNRAEADKRLADMDGPYKKFSQEDIDNNPHLWTKLELNRSPLDEGLIGHAKGISEGTYGSVIDRSYRYIHENDPFKHMYSDEMYKSNDELMRHNAIMDLALTNAHWATAEMQDRLPQAVIDIKMAARDVKKLVFLRNKVNYNQTLNFKIKQARLDGIDKAIKKLEFQLKPLLTKAWFKGKDPRNFPDIRMVDIYRNKDIREATIQYYAMHSVSSLMQPKNAEGMNAFIRDLHKKIGIEYKDFISYSHGAGYGHLTMNERQLKAFRIGTHDSKFTLEDAIQREIGIGVENFGPAFLFHFGMPRTDFLSLGVYEGKVMPTAIKPSANYKRVLRFIMEKIETGNKGQGQDYIGWKGLAEMIQKADTHFGDLFSGNLRFIPTNPSELNSYLQNVPTLGNKLQTFIGMNYTDFTFKKNILDQHTFGLGREYSNNISFLNQVNQVFHGGNENRTQEFETATRGLSNLNQLTMESGFMDPMSYFQMVEMYKREIGNLGLDNAISGGSNTFGNTRGINPAMQQNPLAALILGKHGISLNPIKIMGSYKMNMLLRFNEQAKEIITVQEKNGKNWEEKWKNDEEGGFWCKNGGLDVR